MRALGCSLPFSTRCLLHPGHHCRALNPWLLVVSPHTCNLQCSPSPALPQVSYCILAGIGVSSILVFWMVSLHRSRERQRRLKRAKRAFTNRWHSVTSSMGLAASAVAAFKAKGAAAADGNGVQGSAPSTRSGQGGVRGGAPRLRSRLHSSRVSWGSDLPGAAGAAANAAAAAGPVPAAGGAATTGEPEAQALPASPFEGAAGGAAAGRWKAAAAAGAAARPAPALGAADSVVGSGVQLLPAQPTSSGAWQRQLETAGTISGPQGGGEGADIFFACGCAGLLGGPCLALLLTVLPC